MTTHYERIEQLPVGRRRLWVGILAAPAAFVLAEGVGYYFASRSCEPPVGLPLLGTAHPAGTQLVISGLALILALAGLWIASGNVRALRGRSRADGSAEWGRASFMSVGGVIVSTLFAGGIVLFALSAFLVNACSQAR